MAEHYPLSGKVALVTGGARGIGHATAAALVDRGASVALVDLDAEAVETAAAALHQTRAIGLVGDVTDRGAMQRAVSLAAERLGPVDIVVANAGIATRVATFRTMASENFERVLDVNLMGVYHTVEAALPQVVPRRGHVVVISSIYAFINGVGAIPYAMAKAGVEQLGRGLRVELAGHGVGVTVAYFGWIDTEMVHRAIDADPLSDRLMATFPPPLRKRIPAAEAGEGIVAAIERRRPEVILPRRWRALSLLRGILAPVSDAQLLRDRRSREMVALLDSRGGEQQDTTA